MIFAWSGLASAFVPLALVYALRGKPSEAQALLMMLGGIATALGSRYFGYHEMVYEGMPGILVGLLLYPLTQAAVRRRRYPQ